MTRWRSKLQINDFNHKAHNGSQSTASKGSTKVERIRFLMSEGVTSMNLGKLNYFTSVALSFCISTQKDTGLDKIFISKFLWPLSSSPVTSLHWSLAKLPQKSFMWEAGHLPLRASHFLPEVASELDLQWKGQLQWKVPQEHFLC